MAQTLFCQACVYFNAPDSTCRQSAPIGTDTAAGGGKPNWYWPNVSATTDWCGYGMLPDGTNFVDAQQFNIVPQAPGDKRFSKLGLRRT